jgi:hypothetical protein
VKVLQTPDGKWAIQGPTGIVAPRKYYTQRYAEVIAASMAVKLGIVAE